MTGTQSVAVASRGKPEARRPEPFELKGTMASFTVLRLKSTDLQLVEHQLRAKTSQLPSLFLDAPVLIDLAPLGDEAAALPLAEVARLVRACQMVPVAVAHVPDGLRAAAVDAGLGLWRGPISTRIRAGAEPTAMPSHSGPSVGVSETPGPQPALYNGPVVITKPVRGGQVVYAQNNDLVVLAPVNPGAQVIADGHVHVYAPDARARRRRRAGPARRAHLLPEAGSRAAGHLRRVRDGRRDSGRDARPRRAGSPRKRRMSSDSRHVKNLETGPIAR